MIHLFIISLVFKIGPHVRSVFGGRGGSQTDRLMKMMDHQIICLPRDIVSQACHLSIKISVLKMGTL